MRFQFALLLFACSAIALPAAGEPCANLRPAQDELGYRARLGPDRCEGLYQSPVAGEIIELLSFLQRPITYDAQKDKTISIAVPDVEVLREKPVAVVARALPLKVYYRMDAQVSSGNPLSWPISEVIIPAGLAPGDVGVVGTTQTPNGLVFVPLNVGTSAASSPTKAPVIIFRSSSDLEKFLWRVYGSGPLPDWKNVSPKKIIAGGDPIILSVERPVSGAILTLEIAAKPVESDWTRTRMSVCLP